MHVVQQHLQSRRAIAFSTCSHARRPASAADVATHPPREGGRRRVARRYTRGIPKCPEQPRVPLPRARAATSPSAADTPNDGSRPAYAHSFFGCRKPGPNIADLRQPHTHAVHVPTPGTVLQSSRGAHCVDGSASIDPDPLDASIFLRQSDSIWRLISRVISSTRRQRCSNTANTPGGIDWSEKYGA